MPLPKKSTNRNSSLPSLDEDFQSVQIETVADEEPSYTNSLPVQESMEDDSHLYATHEEPIYENSKEEKKKKKFIDKKKKKLKPFGNKVSKYDERKDVAVAKKVQRGLVLGGILIIIALGVKNTFFPSNSYTTDEIAQIAKTTAGQTNFPIDKGQAFAEQFITYYVNLDSNDAVSRNMLSYFYTGTMPETNSGNGHATANPTVEAKNNKQRIIGVPVTYEKRALTDFSSNYKISVLVTDENGQAQAANQNPTSHWLSFSVNVYYDAKTGAMSIHKGDPVIMPTYPITNSDSAKEEGKIGTGDEDTNMKQALKSTIQGYWKAFSTSSVTSHDEINQYISDKEDKDLYSGFNKTMKLATDDPNTDITYKVYTSTNADEWKVDVTVKWADNTSSDSKKAAIYTGRYIMTIKKIGEDKYVVTRAAPYLYV